MTESIFCSNCGTRIEASASFCKKCGYKVNVDSQLSEENEQTSFIVSQKSASTALLLCLFLGPLGVHRFYVGKIGTGLLMLLTGGGFGIWALIDLIVIANCQFSDSHGHILVFKRGKGSTLKRVLSILGLVIAGLLIYLTALISMVFYATSGISSVVHDELAAIRSGDYEKAYSYTAKEFQSTTSLRDFKKSISQIPSLKNNKSISLNERKIENKMGTIKGTLKSSDGVITPVEFQLIKEGETWKILMIHVIPQSGIQSEVKSNKESNLSPVGSSSLSNEYSDNKNRFSVKYPSNWIHEQPNKTTVLFGEKQEDSSSFYFTISIQTVHPIKKDVRISAQKYIEAVKKQASTELSNFTIISQNEMELPQNPKRFKGEGLVFTYVRKNSTIKQMLIIITRDDDSTFYTWSYTATIEQFDKNLPKAKAMFESWNIY